METGNRDYSFSQDTEPNRFYAVGSTRSNVSGVVTVVPDAHGEPQVGLDCENGRTDPGRDRPYR